MCQLESDLSQWQFASQENPSRLGSVAEGSPLSRKGGLKGNEIAELLGMYLNTVARIRRRFVVECETPAIDRKPRQTLTPPPIINGEIEHQLVAICCSDLPEGHVCWTMQILADELKSRRLITQISAEQFIAF